MKIASNDKYGPPSVIEIKDVEVPAIQPKQILVKVKYSTVNRTDSGFLRAKPFIARLITGLFKPKYSALGCEFSGVVESVGAEVTEFKPGDKVFGFDDQHFGGHAQYKVIAEHKMVTKIPPKIDFKTAAAALEGAHYALFYIYKHPPANRTKVFVNGATGAIGSAAVQILKARGYYVEASSTEGHVKTIKALGADKVIKWQTSNITDEANKCDVYFDAVGKSSFKEACKIINEGGLYLSSELGHWCQNPLLSLINPVQKIITKRSIKFPLPRTRKQEAQTVADLLQTGKFKPLVDREYDLAEIQKAYEYVESGKKIGNVVIKIPQG